MLLQSECACLLGAFSSNPGRGVFVGHSGSAEQYCYGCVRLITDLYAVNACYFASISDSCFYFVFCVWWNLHDGTRTALSNSLAVLTQSHYDEYLALPAVKSLEKDKSHAALFQLLHDLSFGSLASTLKLIAQHEAYWVKIGVCCCCCVLRAHASTLFVVFAVDDACNSFRERTW
jgi:hypothetical protein